MQLPFHGVQVCGDILFAARGGNIHSFRLADGSYNSTSRCLVEKDVQPTTGRLVIEVSGNSLASQDEQGPPAKRVKVDNETAEGEDATDRPTGAGDGVDEDEVNGSKQSQRRKKAKKQQLVRPGNISQPSERPMVIILTATRDGSHLLAVTSDKSIWVFEHDGQGQLKELSRRTMPKRPCSILITPDKKDILAADKFGDVYSLPLLPSEVSSQPRPPQEEDTAAEAASSPVPGAPSPSPAPAPNSASPPPSSTAAPPRAPFKPQATELTVHTKRNLQALRDQQISRGNLGGTPRRVVDAFERHLLLGHVSLLTAIALGLDERGRPYIITADRDEHVRVSRGTREQAHVVEAFCLGHEEFVNRIVVPEGMGRLLVSAGGDREVFVWRWREGRLVARTDLLGPVRQVVPGAAKLAVTGLCCWSGGETGATRVVVGCERVPALFIFNLKDTGSLEFSHSIRLPGNPLEIGIVDGEKLVVATDPSHKEDGGGYDLRKSLLEVKHASGEYQVLDELVKDLPEASEAEDADIPDEELQRLLYSAEALRKIESEEGAADAE